MRGAVVTIHALRRLEICQASRWHGHANGVRNCHKVYDLLQDGSFQGGQVAQGSGNHSNKTCSHTAESALKSDGTHAMTDVDQFIDFAQRRGQDDRISRLRGYVAVRTESYSHGCCHESGGIIDAVPNE